jgi:putative ABC transport system ATP-binding protein
MRGKSRKIIELKNVHKVYHLREGEIPIPALKEVNLDIHDGEFIVILGASGSGKSTLMNMIGALKFSESKLAQTRGKKIGFVFQQFNLVPILDALRNVTLPMIFQDVSEEKRIARAKELLRLVGLKERVTHKPTELSGGEQQRVAISRALANDPDIILADEPTGNLDSKTGKQIMEIISKLHKEEGKTIILVTHDVNLLKYAYRTIYLKDGMVIKDNHKKRR